MTEFLIGIGIGVMLMVCVRLGFARVKRKYRWL